MKRYVILLYLFFFFIISINIYAQDYFKEGNKKFENNDFKGAIIEFEKFIDANKFNNSTVVSATVDNAYLRLALANLYICNLEKSKIQFTELLKRAYYSNELKFWGNYCLGFISYINNDFQTAIIYLTTAISSYKKSGDAVLFRGICYKELGNISQAQKDFNSVCKNNNDVVTATALFYLGEKQKGVDQIIEIIKSNPSWSNYYQLATLYAISDDTNNTMIFLDIALNKGLKYYPVYLFYTKDFKKFHDDANFLALLDKYNIVNIYKAKNEAKIEGNPVEVNQDIKSIITDTYDKLKIDSILNYFNERNDKISNWLKINSNLTFYFIGGKVICKAINEVEGYKEGDGKESSDYIGNGSVNGDTVSITYTIKDVYGNEVKRTFVIKQDKKLIELLSDGNITFSKYSSKNNLIPVEDYLPGIVTFEKSGYSSLGYLYPIEPTPELLLKYFRLSTFDPSTAAKLSFLDERKILDINMDAIYQTIEKDRLFYAPNITLDLKVSSIPEISSYFAQLKGKNKFEIAAEKDTVIATLLKLREIYFEANKRYQDTRFRFYGKCFAFEDEYDFDEQLLDIHLFIPRENLNVYIETIRIPLSLKEADDFFKNPIMEGRVLFEVFPGFERKGLGITGGGLKQFWMPNMILVDWPNIYFGDPQSPVLRATTTSIGIFWPDWVDVNRWDLNKNNRPDKINRQIIPGIKL